MANIRKLVLLTVVAAVAIAAAGWFLLVSPKNSEAADLRTQTDKETASQAALQQQIAMLTQDERHAAQYQAVLSRLKQHMPDGTDQPALIREIFKAADASHVDLVEVTPGAPVVPTLAALPTATPTAGSGSPTVAPTTAAPTTTSATPSDGSTPTATAAPVKTAPPVSMIPMSITVNGNYDEIKDFVDRIASFKRAFLVSGINLAVGQPVVAPPTATSSAAPVAQGYTGHLTALITGSVFSAQAPAAVGTFEVTPVSKPTLTPAATPSRSAK